MSIIMYNEDIPTVEMASNPRNSSDKIINNTRDVMKSNKLWNKKFAIIPIGYWSDLIYQAEI